MSVKLNMTGQHLDDISAAGRRDEGVARKPSGSKEKAPSRAAIATVARPVRRNAVVRKPAAPSTKRGSETRERLKEAAARVLERIGYRALRLNDIAAEADVNVSLVYHYFSGKADITSEVLNDVIERLSAEAPRQKGEGDRFETILAANRHLIGLYERTPGLMRCLLHFDEEEAEFSQIYRRLSVDWNRRVARDIARRCGEDAMPEGQRLMVAYALGGMVDDFLFEMYVDRNPLMHAEFPDSEAVARFLAILWFRTLYAANPDGEALGEFIGFERLTLGR
jgi:AcrR family transcriptional regulator